MSFRALNTEAIKQALGNISELPRSMQRAVTSQLETSFKPIPEPGMCDWLVCNPEKGQTVEQFKRDPYKAIPHGSHRTIYIQPVGSFDYPRAAPLDIIAQFASVFFSGCDVEVLSPIGFSEDMPNRDILGTIQYLTDGFYVYLKKTRANRDQNRELVCVAVTMADLYPRYDWTFIYGQARKRDGLGVYSFARLDPSFPMSPEELRTVPITDQDRTKMLRRCVRILLHELGHLFGLNHCIYYMCLLNGFNNQTEMDRKPLHICPVCLHKLYSTLKFDVRKLYEDFAKLCETHGLQEESDWYRTRLSYLGKS